MLYGMIRKEGTASRAQLLLFNSDRPRAMLKPKGEWVVCKGVRLVNPKEGTGRAQK